MFRAGDWQNQPRRSMSSRSSRRVCGYGHGILADRRRARRFRLGYWAEVCRRFDYL